MFTCKICEAKMTTLLFRIKDKNHSYECRNCGQPVITHKNEPLEQRIELQFELPENKSQKEEK